MAKRKPKPDATSPAPVSDSPSPIDLERVEDQVKKSAHRKIGKLIDDHPDEAVKLLRSWMREDT